MLQKHRHRVLASLVLMNTVKGVLIARDKNPTEHSLNEVALQIKMESLEQMHKICHLRWSGHVKKIDDVLAWSLSQQADRNVSKTMNISIMKLMEFVSTRCGLVTPNGNIDMNQSHQAITWTNIELSSEGLVTFRLRQCRGHCGGAILLVPFLEFCRDPCATCYYCFTTFFCL